MKFSTWFLEELEKYRNGDRTLPDPPFKLYPWMTLAPGGYEVLEEQVKRAIAHQQDPTKNPSEPRMAYDALHKDLKQLYALTRVTEPLKPKSLGTVAIANINAQSDIMQTPGAVYVGRHNSRRGLRQSPLHNPFAVGRDGDRDEVCEKCLERVIKPALASRQGAVWAELDKLSDRLLNGESLTLVCYCVPERCHAMDIANALSKLVLDKKGAIAHQGVTP